MMLLLCAFAALQSKVIAPPTLRVGDNAPSIAAARLVKGSLPTSFKDGRVHVVEFWGTWCAPCRESIPHLTQVAHQYAGNVDVSAIDVMEDMPVHPSGDDFMPVVRNFVRLQGARMDYNIGVDSPNGILYKTWITASGLDAVPTAFIVDLTGRIVWIGSPYNMDEAIKVVLTHAKNAAEAAELVRAKRKSEISRINDAAKAGDITKVLEIWGALPDFVESEPVYAQLMQASPDAATKFAESVANSPKSGLWQLQGLSEIIGRGYLDSNSKVYFFPKHDYAVAVQLMKIAENKLDPSEESRLNWLAHLAMAYAKNGEFDKAVEAEGNAIRNMEASKKNYEVDLKQAKECLEHFRAHQAY